MWYQVVFDFDYLNFLTLHSTKLLLNVFHLWFAYFWSIALSSFFESWLFIFLLSLWLHVFYFRSNSFQPIQLIDVVSTQLCLFTIEEVAAPKNGELLDATSPSKQLLNNTRKNWNKQKWTCSLCAYLGVLWHVWFNLVCTPLMGLLHFFFPSFSRG